MANEQLGTGNPQDTNTIPGNLVVGGSVAFNGVTSVPTVPTISTVAAGTTTGFPVDAAAAINALIDALDALGLVNKGA